METRELHSVKPVVVYAQEMGSIRAYKVFQNVSFEE